MIAVLFWSVVLTFTCLFPLLLYNADSSIASTRESINTSIRRIGYFSRLVTAINILQSQKKQKIPSFFGKYYRAAHSVWDVSMTFRNCIFSISAFSNSLAFCFVL